MSTDFDGARTLRTDELLGVFVEFQDQPPYSAEPWSIWDGTLEPTTADGTAELVLVVSARLTYVGVYWTGMTVCVSNT
jgi:hypothetical protein